MPASSAYSSATRSRRAISGSAETARRCDDRRVRGAAWLGCTGRADDSSLGPTGWETARLGMMSRWVEEGFVGRIRPKAVIRHAEVAFVADGGLRASR